MPGEKRRTLENTGRETARETAREENSQREYLAGNTTLSFLIFLYNGDFPVQRLLYPRFVWVVVMVMKCG